MRSSLAAALRALIRKDGPVVGDVHVPSADWGPPSRKKKKRRDLALALRKAADLGLYVARPVTPECDARLRAWAARLGLPPLDANLHVTLVHSTRAVPWTCDDRTLSVPSHSLLRAGPLGAEGAVVLFFRSRELHARWAQSRREGAVWDYGGVFKPHLTLYYGGPVPASLPDFPLEFGPEVFGALEQDVFDLAKADDVVTWYADTANAQALNCALRGERPLTAEQQHAVQQLDSMLATRELASPTAVFRGVDADNEFGQALLDATSGQTFSAHGYTSTTTDPEVARSWGPVVLAGVLPAGTHTVEVRRDLGELLLPRGASFTVQSRQGNALSVEWHVPVHKAAFDGSEHPRDDHGRFVSGVPELGPLPKKTPRRVVWVDRTTGEPLPAEAQQHLSEISGKGFNAPNYTNQQYFPPDPTRKGTYVGVVTDAKGRSKRFYLDDNEQAKAGVKAQRVRAFADGYESYNRKLDAATIGPHATDDAMALRLISKTGMRPGSDRDTGADAKAFGATNMPTSAATVEGDTVHFRFPAKNGKTYVTSVADRPLAEWVRRRQASGAPRLFDTNETKVRSVFKRLTGNAALQLKDIRTAHGTAIAQRELLAHNFRPATPKEFAQLQKTIATKVSAHLQNTPKVALEKYILDSVWHGYRPGGLHLRSA